MFRSGPVEIAYLDEGEGEPIVLVHGFASNKEVNWVYPGWVSTLTRAGRRVIALDNRGHGASTKLYDPAAYHSGLMAGDVRALLDHLGIARADVMGYSMGARITAYPARARTRNACAPRSSAASASTSSRASASPEVDRRRARGAARSPSVTDPRGRTFRAFAEQTRSDLAALAACIRGSRQTLARDEVAGITVPVLVAVGSKDDIAGSAAALAALVPGAQALDIPGRDHMLAVGDRVFKTGVLEFLAARP